ncbi:tyrosine-type recombinase/integrase [Mameliella sp. CS4]|uniref:tyrosine-type recombinase/integrase n=1 Tax=Mameliella sp. CS4 TaxID=2862329 RepID=UPI001C5E48A0|nr:tyrosine-type recombinase/integrase [Mameliella sp. CS4]MBW4982533.1 tyrosine-type recombinase/integrase [Mameliella sp. CS4]
MIKRHLPPNIYRTRGVLYFYRRPGPWIKLETQFPEGEPVPFALHQERERLLSQPAPVKPGQDIAAVIRHYMASRKYARKASRTRADYEAHLIALSEKLGKIEPRRIERRHVIEWLDAWAKAATPHLANYRLRVFRIVMEHAIDMGLLSAGQNPAKGVTELEYDRVERQPWPVNLVQAFRSEAEGDTLLLFEMLLGLGQRVGDTLSLRWPQYDGDWFAVRQRKTGNRVWLPVPPALAETLDARPRDALFIFPNADLTGHLTYSAARQRFMRVRKRIGAEAYDIHALRHTRASELAAAGHDDATIMAITGHKSVAALRIYTEEARQKARAERTKNRT